MPFPLFQTHLDFAHSYWKKLVQPGDILIDATCGNGQDTLFLAQLGLTEESGTLYTFDIQEQAITNSRHLLQSSLPKKTLERVAFLKQCHSQFPPEIAPNTVKLIVYNLGYLPKGDKAITTMTETTLLSLTHARNLLCEGGVLSVTCYPGHEEGEREEECLIDHFCQLNRFEWNCSYHRWINRKKGPTIILIQKQKSEPLIPPDSTISDDQPH